MRGSFGDVLAPVLAGLLAASDAGATLKFTVLAASGQPAPGERTGEVYNYQTFGDAAVNAGGQVSFSGLGTSAAPGEGRAVWSGFPGAVDLVLRSGDPSPLPGVDFDRFVQMKVRGISDAGETLATTFLDSFEGVVVRGTGPSALDVLIREDTPAPGTAFNFSLILDACMAPNGHALTGALLSDNTTGLWLADDTSVTLLARQGDDIPDSNGFELDTSPFPLALADDGSAVWQTNIRSGPTTTFGLVFKPAGEPLRLLLRRFQAAPDVAGFLIENIDVAALVDGSVLVAAQGEDISEDTEHFLFRGTSAASMRLAARLSPFFAARNAEVDSVTAIAVRGDGRIFALLSLIDPSDSSDFNAVVSIDAAGSITPLLTTGDPITIAGSTGTVDFMALGRRFDDQNRVPLHLEIVVPGVGIRGVVTLLEVIEEAPTLKVAGPKRITTAKPRLTLRGTTKDDGSVTRVEVKVGDGKFRPAKGTASWKFKARLKPGVNTVQIRAVDDERLESDPVRVKIIRKTASL